MFASSQAVKMSRNVNTFASNFDSEFETTQQRKNKTNKHNRRKGRENKRRQAFEG